MRHYHILLIISLLFNCENQNDQLHNKKEEALKNNTQMTFPKLNGHELNFQTTHHQFYIHDQRSPMATDSENFWTEEAFETNLAIEKGIIGVGTRCYGPVKGEIVFHDSVPVIRFLDEADHIVEGDLKISSGEINISNCTDGDIVFLKQLNNGNYRVRVSMFNLDSVEGDEGDDYYLIEAWLAPPQKVAVIKSHKTPGSIAQ